MTTNDMIYDEQKGLRGEFDQTATVVFLSGTKVREMLGNG